MPAKKDFTVWKVVEGDHADDVTYLRVPLAPGEPSTDEAQTAAEAEAESEED